MTALRKLIKTSYAPIVFGSVFFILVNYCGLRSFEMGDHGAGPDHHSTEIAAHGDSDHHATDLHNIKNKTEQTDYRHDKDKSNGEKGFCCPSSFCCNTINLNAELRDQLYYFFLEATRHTALTPVALELSDPFKAQEVEWLHDIGPPQIVFKEPFHIKAFPAHAPPLG